MKRDIRYYNAKTWAERRAKAMPGVTMTAAIDDERLSCAAEADGRTTWHTWQCVEEARNESAV